MPKPAIYDQKAFMPVVHKLTIDEETRALLCRVFLPDGRRRESNASLAQSLGIADSAAGQRVRSAAKVAWEAFLSATPAAPAPRAVAETPANARTYWSSFSGGNFETLDFVFGAALLCRGAEYLGLLDPEYKTGHVPRYAFKADPALVDRCREERARGALALPDAGTYWDKVRMLKDERYQWNQAHGGARNF